MRWPMMRQPMMRRPGPLMAARVRVRVCECGRFPKSHINAPESGERGACGLNMELGRETNTPRTPRPERRAETDAKQINSRAESSFSAGGRGRLLQLSQRYTELH